MNKAVPPVEFTGCRDDATPVSRDAAAMNKRATVATVNPPLNFLVPQRLTNHER
jgi:hypothetical protein